MRTRFRPHELLWGGAGDQDCPGEGTRTALGEGTRTALGEGTRTALGRGPGLLTAISMHKIPSGVRPYPYATFPFWSRVAWE